MLNGATDVDQRTLHNLWMLRVVQYVFFSRYNLHIVIHANT